MEYAEKPTDYMVAAEGERGSVDAWWSLGVHVSPNGRIGDVLVGSPADKAGLEPGMDIFAVNGRAYSGFLLKGAIDTAKQSKDPIELITSNTSYFKIVRIDYHGGQRYPYLEQVKGELDVLGEILKPMTKAKSSEAQRK